MVPYSKDSFLIMTFFRIIAGGIILYAILCAFMYLYQDQLLFIRQSITNERVEYIRTRQHHVEEITIPTAEGITLHGWWVNDYRKTAESADNVVIYFGGNAEEVSYMIDEASAFNNWSFVLINYRGYGLSEGNPSEKMLYEDALRIYDALLEQETANPSRIIVMGRSLGTGVAAHLARHRQVQGAIFISPYDSMVKVAKDAYPFLPVNLLLRNRFSVLDNAVAIDIPVYALVALEDSVILPERSLKLLEKWKGEIHVTEVAHAGHNNLAGTAEYRRFLKESLDAFRH
jgi:uncharacterized protein